MSRAIESLRVVHCVPTPMHYYRCCLMLVLLAFMLPASAKGTSEVVLDTGKVSGVVDGDIVKFLGVPYAAPPVGALRWRAPQPAAKWSRVRVADRYAPACLQPPDPAPPPGDPGVSEDCLYLNVWTTPAKTPKRPVLVWLHGGSFVFGSGASALYDRSDWPQRGVVLVTLNYRLGRFGFFAHPALTAESSTAPLGNYGLLDIIAALGWVQRNIAAFGGDPENVTIGGVSAGGALTYEVASTPLARGLFRRAIAESAIALTHWPALGEAEAAGARALAAAGVTATTASELRALPASRIVGDFAFLDDVSLRPTPIIDGRALPLHEASSLIRGAAAGVPFLVGTNSWEGSVMQGVRVRLDLLVGSMGVSPDAVQAKYATAIDRRFTGAQRDGRLAMLLYGDQAFVAPARHMARQLAMHAPTFLYHFSYLPQDQRSRLLGTPHGGELGYVFNALGTIPNQVPTASDRALARTVSTYWINFVKTGNPNGPQLPRWPAYDREREELLELGNEGPTVRPHFLEERLDVAAAGTGDGRSRPFCVLLGTCAP